MALIYIVEDDDNIREIETIALKNSNYMVKDFARASDFYKALEVLLPDLVLLDVMLPDENGCDIVRRLRSNTVTKRLPVIMSPPRPRRWTWSRAWTTEPTTISRSPSP